MTCNTNSSPTVIPPIYRVRYDDWDFVFKFFESDRVTPIDITDWTFKFAIYKNNTLQIVEYASPDPEIVTEPLDGKVTISVPKTETDQNPTATYTYYLQYVDDLGKQRTPLADAPLIVQANKDL